MKLIISIVTICLVYLFFGTNYNNEIIVPKDAIRFRVIANSNDTTDQHLKIKIKLEVEQELSKILKNEKNYEKIDELITKNLTIIDNKIKEIVNKDGNIIKYSINYGENYFPEKEYNGIKYESGNYKSLVIIIGDGLGDNWWCVLFPPLCLLDQSNYSEYEYKLYVKEILNQYID